MSERPVKRVYSVFLSGVSCLNSTCLYNMDYNCTSECHKIAPNSIDCEKKVIASDPI